MHAHGNDENKHDKVTFQHTAVDLISVYIWPEIFMTDIVFEKIIVGCAYYTSITRRVGLNRAHRCVESKTKVGKYISLIQDDCPERHVLFSWRSCCREIITLKYI